MEKIEEMTRKELEDLPLDPLELETEAKKVYFLKNGRKHGSGYACISSFAEINGQPYTLGVFHDSLNITGCKLDVIFKNGLFRFFPSGRNTKIIIGTRGSEFDAQAVE